MTLDPMNGVLLALAEGGIQTPQVLARKLELSQSLLAGIIAALTVRGYLAATPTACGGCSGCAISESCVPDSERPALLILTEKGRRAAEAYRS
jgi:DNA-binding MarR family transcriptional regulator